MNRSLALLALLFAAAASAGEPASVKFEGEDYRFAARETDAARIAEHYLRGDETLERFSRRLTIADQLKAANAKTVALGVIGIAKLRTPGLAPESFAAEDRPEHDISVAWYSLTDDNAAVERHLARFVDLKGGGVREYHFTVRRYLNGQTPDAAFAALRNAVDKATLERVEALAALDRAPVDATSKKQP